MFFNPCPLLLNIFFKLDPNYNEYLVARFGFLPSKNRCSFLPSFQERGPRVAANLGCAKVTDFLVYVWKTIRYSLLPSENESCKVCQKVVKRLDILNLDKHRYYYYYGGLCLHSNLGFAGDQGKAYVYSAVLTTLGERVCVCSVNRLCTPPS